MKKTFLFTVLFLFFAFFIYAQSTTDNNSGKRDTLNLGAGFSYNSNPEILGGHIEFGFSHNTGIFFLQGQLLARAGGFTVNDLDSTLLSLSGRVLLGRGHDITGIYVFLEGGTGVYSNSEKDFSFNSLVYNFGFGGGFELGKGQLGCFYIEAGYLGQILISSNIHSGVLLQAGWRIYFH